MSIKRAVGLALIAAGAAVITKKVIESYMEDDYLKLQSRAIRMLGLARRIRTKNEDMYGLPEEAEVVPTCANNMSPRRA